MAATVLGGVLMLVLNVISMKRVIKCTKFHFSRARGSRGINISMLNFELLVAL